MRTVAAFVLAAAFVLTGCSSLSEVFNAPTGPNAPFKTLSADQAQNAVVFRGVVVGACEDLSVAVDGGPTFAAGCLLPVAVSGEVSFRQVFCGGPEHLAQCRAWGSRPNRVEVSFMGQAWGFSSRTVFIPSGKDQLKGREF